MCTHFRDFCPPSYRPGSPDKDRQGLSSEEDKYEQEQKGIEPESLKYFWDFLAQAWNNLTSKRVALPMLILTSEVQKKEGISVQDSDVDLSFWEHNT